MNVRKILLGACILAPNMIDTHQQYEDRPTISLRWMDEDICYQRQASYFKKEPLFDSFDAPFFNQHLLPQGQISLRNDPTKSVDGHELSNLVQGLLEEISEGKKNFTHFKVLKCSEFDRKQNAGLMVLKFKDYPFVVKIFSESPESFLNPYKKGFIHGCMSVVSGGINRYLAGFSRVKNLEMAKQLVASTPEYEELFDFPRKWFWLPSDVRWFEMRGSHFGLHSELVTKLPATYAIIADEIVSQVPLSKIKKRYGKTIFTFCKDSCFSIDPNTKNYRYELASHKLIIIDTERFSSLIGFPEDFDAAGYFTLHVKMGFKAIRECLSKSESRKIISRLRSLKNDEIKKSLV